MSSPSVKAALALVTIAVSVGLAGCGGSPSVPVPDAPPGVTGTGTASAGHVASVPAGSTVAATLNVESGMTALTIRAGGRPGQLASATAAIGSGQTPVLTAAAGGVVTLGLASTAPGGGPTTVAVQLDGSVVWTINLDGGATTYLIDMRQGRVAAITLTAGVTHAVINVPARSGTQLVREVGGASELTVTVPASMSSRVQVGGGASQVQLGTATHAGVAAGRVFSDLGYAHARERLDLDLVGGVSAVEVTH